MVSQVGWDCSCINSVFLPDASTRPPFPCEGCQPLSLTWACFADTAALGPCLSPKDPERLRRTSREMPTDNPPRVATGQWMSRLAAIVPSQGNLNVGNQ